MHDEWNRAQNRSRVEADTILAKLVNENNELRDRLTATQSELKDVRAGRKEEASELRLAQERLRRLEGNQASITCLAVNQHYTDLYLTHWPSSSLVRMCG